MTAIMSIRPRFGGYAKAAAFRLFSTPHGMAYTKILILVDDYVDPFQLEQVMWALSTKVKPDKDITIIENCTGIPLDPTSIPAGMQSKVIIDATTPAEPDTNPRTVELLENPKGTAQWMSVLTSLLTGNRHIKNREEKQ